MKHSVSVSKISSMRTRLGCCCMRLIRWRMAISLAMRFSRAASTLAITLTATRFRPCDPPSCASASRTSANWPRPSRCCMRSYRS